MNRNISGLIKVEDPMQWAEPLSYSVECLINTARLALDNDGVGGELEVARLYAVEGTLEVAAEMMKVVGDGIEFLAYRAGINTKEAAE